LSGNQYGGYGPGGGYTQGPPQGLGMPPTIPFPGAKPAGRSGCSSCLIGCVVAAGVLILVIAGVTWWGVTWLEDNIFDKQPIAIQEQPMTDEDIAHVASLLTFLKGNSGEHMDVTITPAQVQYFIIAILTHSASSTSQSEQNATPETELKIPTSSDLEKRDWKLLIDFPEDGKLDFAASVPLFEKKWHFNLTGSMDFEISDGKPSVKLNRATVGKFKIEGTFAESSSKEIQTQFMTDPNLQKLWLRVPEFKIKRGKAHIRIVAAGAEVTGEAPASQ